MTAQVRKLDTGRWESVHDLARWLLTHADEYEWATVVVCERRPADGAPGNLETLTAPDRSILEVLGGLELAKRLYTQWAEDAVGDPEWPSA